MYIKHGAGIMVEIVAIFMMIALPQLNAAETFTSKSLDDAGTERVTIGPNAIKMPLGRILLVRRNNEYGAVILTSNAKEGSDSAKYEAYYQGDGSGDFLRSSVQLRKGDLSQSKSFGIGRLSFDFGNQNIECGPIRLGWSSGGWIYFYSTRQKQGDYGIELAPTNWTRTSQVSSFDNRLEWFRYDSFRQERELKLYDLHP